VTPIKRILIIEDDPYIAELVQDYLTMNGFEVQHEADGLAGLAALRKESYALIILDLMLPGLDGLSLLQQLEQELDCPLLIVSAKDDELSKIKGLSLGADDYITKPFSLAELLARVQAHLSKYQRLRERYGNPPAGKDSLVVRGLKLERDSRRVWYYTKEINLTGKEFDLLTLFMNHPNRVFNREEIFERVWGQDALGDLQTVTVHIARLREKIEENPSKPQFIETVWGAGYRFRV